MSFDKYERMKKAFIIRLTQQEDAVSNRLLDADLEARGGAAAIEVGEDGQLALAADAAPLAQRPRDVDLALTIRELVNWYVGEQATELQDLKALKLEKRIARKVLLRLLRVDGVLYHPVDYEALPEGEAPADDDDRLVSINPDHS